MFRGDARLRRYRGQDRMAREWAADVGGADVSRRRREAAKTGDAAAVTVGKRTRYSELRPLKIIISRHRQRQSIAD